MLISVRNNEEKLLVKDILDIDFDMYVEEEAGKYNVYLNKRMRLDEQFNNQECAEKRMLEIADVRNKLEEELRNY